MSDEVASLIEQIYGTDARDRVLSRLNELWARGASAEGGESSPTGAGATNSSPFPFGEADIAVLTEPGWPPAAAPNSETDRDGGTDSASRADSEQGAERSPNADQGRYADQGPDTFPDPHSDSADNLFRFLDDELEGSVSLYHVRHASTGSVRSRGSGAAGDELGERFGFGIDLTIRARESEAGAPAATDVEEVPGTGAGTTAEAGAAGAEAASADGSRPARRDEVGREPGEGSPGTERTGTLSCSTESAGSFLDALSHVLKEVDQGLRLVRIKRSRVEDTRAPSEQAFSEIRGDQERLRDLFLLVLRELAPQVGQVLDRSWATFDEAGAATGRVPYANEPSLLLLEDDSILECFEHAVAQQDARFLCKWVESRRGTTPYCVLPYRENLLADLIDPALPPAQRARRVALSFAVLLSLPGIPALSAELLTAQEARTAPDYTALVHSLHSDDSLQHLVLEYFKRLAASRAGSDAFHPQAPFEVVETSPEAFVIVRWESDGSPLLCAHNISSEVAELTINARRLNIPPKSGFVDLISGDYFFPTWEGQEQFGLDLEPEEVMWLTLQA